MKTLKYRCAETHTHWKALKRGLCGRVLKIKEPLPRTYGQVCVCVQERRNLEMNEFSRGGKLSAAQAFNERAKIATCLWWINYRFSAVFDERSDDGWTGMVVGMLASEFQIRNLEII